MKKKISKEEKRKLKEKKTIFYFVKKKEQKKQVYISKKMLKNKYRNSQTFTNADAVSDDGVIKLKTGEYARVYSVDAIDLSLTSNTQKKNFFNQLKFLYQLRDLNLRIYKLDDMIDLNANKDYYNKFKHA